MVLCGLLRGSARDADDVLEHAALLLWKTLCRDDRDAAVQALLHVERKVWNRIARLLFASSSGVVNAIVAVMCSLVSPSSPSPLAAREPLPCADTTSAANGSPSSMTGGDGEDGGDEATAEIRECSPQSIHERIWHSEWWQRIIEKIEDCYSLCLSQQTTQPRQQGQRSMSSSASLRGNMDVKTCERLLTVVGTVLRHHSSLVSASTDGEDAGRGSDDRTRMNESIDLFVSLSASPISSIAICASTSLFSLLQDNGEASELAATKLFGDSVMIGHIVKWLKDSGEPPPPECRPPQRVKASTRSSHAEHEKNGIIQLQCLYFDLFVFAASSQSTEAVKWLVLDKVNPLQLCQQSLSHPSAELQERALNLLTAALQSSTSAHETKASVVCSNIRVSGLLITICWLMGHSHHRVALAASRLLGKVIESSPTSDVLRALVEQGCAIILSTLTPSATRPDDPHAQHDQGNNSNQSTKVLDWMATEIVREQVLGAVVSSVLRSSNVLLQKNVLLSLLLLSQRDAELRELLDGEEESFLGEVVHVAIETGEDGSLATMLLAAALSWCDRVYVLKLDDSGSSFRQSKSGKSLRDAQLGNQTTDEAASDRIPPVIKLTHNNQVVAAEVSGVLLYSLSKPVRKWVSTMPTEPQIPLNRFRVLTIQLFVEVLPKSQQEAVITLKCKDFSELSELLELAKFLECSKCWHFTTFAMNHALSPSNWFQVFQFAVTIRHPSLMLRAGKMALECFETETKNGNNTTSDTGLQASESSNGASARRFLELKTAAFEMFREVFHAKTSKRGPDQ
ncbi:hypothetical protein Gpo141_00003965 [Globisporangium polare]